MRGFRMPIVMIATTMSLAAPAAAAAQRDARIAALAAESKALRARGDRAAALARAEQAVALAEAAPGRNGEMLYVALDALTSQLPDQDFDRQFAVFDRLTTVAARARGAASYEAVSALAGRNVLAFVLRKPGASIDAFADALARAIPLATTEEDRAQTSGLALVLAQLYDSTGRHGLAVETVAKIARFYDVPPQRPSAAFAQGMMTLAQRYGEWQDWPRALAMADRAIDASVAFRGARTADIATALKVRGGAYAANARYEEAERDYREAVTLSDGESNPLLQSGAMLNLARFYAMTGRDALAQPLLVRVAEFGRTLPGQSNTRLVALLDLYNAAVRSCDTAAAMRYAMAAREDAEGRGLRQGANYVTVLFAVANANLLAGNRDTAAAVLDDIEAMLPKAVPATSSRYGDLASARGKLAEDRGDYAGGARHYAAAVARWASTPSGDPAQVATMRVRLANSLLRTGDAPGAWRSARAGGDAMTAVAISRVNSGSPQPLERSALAVFDTTLDAAWAVRTGRR